jgi:excinuclease ABC subunit A
LKEINERLNFLLNVGLNYLTLSRESGTLSGGEAQRIRLASQIGSGLTGVLYVLDEPSIGLHQRDNKKLIKALKKLRDLGNTVIVVEHDIETMENSDHIIDIGPEAGLNGGEIIAEGNVKEIIKNEKSITGNYLSGKKFIPVPRNVERQKMVDL